MKDPIITGVRALLLIAVIVGVAVTNPWLGTIDSAFLTIATGFGAAAYEMLKDYS